MCETVHRQPLKTRFGWAERWPGTENPWTKSSQLDMNCYQSLYGVVTMLREQATDLWRSTDRAGLHWTHGLHCVRVMQQRTRHESAAHIL